MEKRCPVCGSENWRVCNEQKQKILVKETQDRLFLEV